MMARIKLTKNTVFFLSVTLAMIAMVWFGTSSGISYSPINTDGINFVPGRVTEVISDQTQVDEHGIRRGQQELRVKLLSGECKGEVIDVHNTLTVEHHVYTRQGQTIIVYLDRQPGDTYYFATVQSYQRSWAIYAIIGLFICLLAAAGGKTGFRSAFGLIFTFVVIIFLMIPLIIKGAPPILLSLGLIICIMVISLISTLGFTKKTYASILGTGVGTVLCCLFFSLMSGALHITGYNVPEVDTLVLIAQNTGIRIGEFLFVSVLIASLGAVMDVSVSVASSVAELSDTGSDVSFEGLFKSGIRIGRDIIGAQANTLIMAFTGSFFITLIMFRIYNYQYNMLINHDDIAIEIIQALASSSALILCAPVTAFIAARVYTKKSKHKKSSPK